MYLSTKNLKVNRPSRKLAAQWLGPFKILEQVGHLYRLDLLKGSRIHPVFAPELLSKDPQNPKPLGEVIATQEEWEVQEILGVKLVRKKLIYQVS